MLPFAAFFIFLFARRHCSKAVWCMLAGAGAGLLLLWASQLGIRSLQARYAGKQLLLTAQVQQIQPGFSPKTVQAVLWVELAGGQKAGFQVHCPSLPLCSAGDRISGRFALEPPDPAQALDSYADGSALCAVYQSDFLPKGKSTGFRARTARLQHKLSQSLQKLLDKDTGGVLAAMIAGDRTALPPEMNAAYRSAGLSHVLVVSGMHVTLLCGGALGPLLSKKREQRYCTRRITALPAACVLCC